MFQLRHTALGLVLATAAIGAAAQAAKEPAVRPAAPAASQPSPAYADRMAAMDRQMKGMREMQEKMATAKTPQERQALMAEHRKTMQEGMSMMNMMGGPGGMGMGMGMGGPGMGGRPMPGNMSERQQMMEKRMDMMQSMMQMMMEHLPPAQAPAK